MINVKSQYHFVIMQPSDSFHKSPTPGICIERDNLGLSGSNSKTATFFSFSLFHYSHSYICLGQSHASSPTCLSFLTRQISLAMSLSACAQILLAELYHKRSLCAAISTKSINISLHDQQYTDSRSCIKAPRCVSWQLPGSAHAPSFRQHQFLSPSIIISNIPTSRQPSKPPIPTLTTIL